MRSKKGAKFVPSKCTGMVKVVTHTSIFLGKLLYFSLPSPQFSAKNLLPLAMPRVHEGRLTIIFRELSWAMLVLSEVKDVPALK